MTERYAESPDKPAEPVAIPDVLPEQPALPQLDQAPNNAEIAMLGKFYEFCRLRPDQLDPTRDNPDDEPALAGACLDFTADAVERRIKLLKSRAAAAQQIYQPAFSVLNRQHLAQGLKEYYQNFGPQQSNDTPLVAKRRAAFLDYGQNFLRENVRAFPQIQFASTLQQLLHRHNHPVAAAAAGTVLAVEGQRVARFVRGATIMSEQLERIASDRDHHGIIHHYDIPRGS